MAIFLFLPAVVSADIVAPYLKGIRQSYKISNINDYPDYLFYRGVYVGNGLNILGGVKDGLPAESLKEGEPFECYGPAHSYFGAIIAIKKNDIKESFFSNDFCNGRHPCVDINNDKIVIDHGIVLNSFRHRHEKDPVNYEVLTFKITSLDDKNLVLENKSITYGYEDGEETKMYEKPGVTPPPSRTVSNFQKSLSFYEHKSMKKVPFSQFSSSASAYPGVDTDFLVILFVSLLATFLVEYVVIRFLSRGAIRNLFLYAFIINLITNPAGNLMYCFFAPNNKAFFIVEGIIVVIESFLMLKFFKVKYKKALLYSFLANLATILISLFWYSLIFLAW